MKNNILKTLFLVCLTLVFTPTITYSAAEKLSGKAPNFTLKSRSGKNIKLSELRGEVVMLNFWASWCGPCRQEMPLLEKIHKKYKRLGFTLLGVNVDSTQKTSKLYDVSAMPTTIIIDRNGNKRFIHKGYKPGYENDYKKLIKKLLRE